MLKVVKAASQEEQPISQVNLFIKPITNSTLLTSETTIFKIWWFYLNFALGMFLLLCFGCITQCYYTIYKKKLYHERDSIDFDLYYEMIQIEECN